jgi:RNA polymerase sigma factor (sigma-70 family)
MIDLDQVIVDCKKNKRKAQVALYNHYAPLLLGVCSRYVNDHSEAQDILQDSFLKIFKNIKDFSGKGHFENWMKRIVVNTAITHFHKEKKHYYHEELDEINESEIRLDISPDKEFEAKELYQMLKTMPDGYKLIFNLYAIEGYKHREIAEKLKIDESTSKTQYLRAKKWLAKEIKKNNW